MNIFHEIKSMISVRQVAESYGLKVNRNGMACCPFHNDKHPSMKIDSSHYYCFGCGAHGDAIGYVAEMFSLSQYDAACKIIQDFNLPIETERKISEDEKNAYRKLLEQNQYAETVKKRFERWADETIDQLKECKQLIEEAKDLIFTKEPGTAVISNGFAYMLHQQEKIEYWLDILCMGDEAEKRNINSFLWMGRRLGGLQQILNEQGMRSWEEIESALDSDPSYSVEDVQQMLSSDEKGRVYQSIDNCMIALQNDPVLAGAICHNDLTCKTDIIKNLGWDKSKGGGIRDVDVDQIDWYLERTYGLKNYKAIGKALNIIASQNHFHPVKERLESLEWDGVSRIADVLPKYLGADQCEYTTEVMLLLMQAAIHRIYDPGCKFEIMVCLVGGQGAGKSSFFRLLAIDDEWFSDDLSKLGDDNIYRKLQGHWIIEMPEMLATVNAKTVEEIKAFLSRPKDNYKIPYETHPEDRPRQCVFVGTSNTLDFLPLDRTGNRRFAPIMVHPERVKKHILEDEHESREYIKQLWAEMMDFYYKHKNYKLKLSKNMEEYLKVMQKEFMPEDTKVGQIQEWLDYCSEDYVCTLMIYREALKHEFDDPKQWELREIGDILNNSIEGWSKGPQHRFEKYGPQRSWKRNEPSGGFVKVPDDTELPFQ